MLILVQMALCLSSVWVTAVATSVYCVACDTIMMGLTMETCSSTDLDLFGAYLLQSTPSHQVV
jgi:hypothetical protein